MSNILERISQISEIEGVTIGKIEQKIGASKGVLYKAIQKNTDIQSKWLVAFVENFPQYSVEWILTGKGEMFVSKKQNATGLVAEHSSINENDKDGIIKLLEENRDLYKEQCENLKNQISLLEKEAKVEDKLEKISLVVETHLELFQTYKQIESAESKVKSNNKM